MALYSSFKQELFGDCLKATFSDGLIVSVQPEGHQAETYAMLQGFWACQHRDCTEGDCTKSKFTKGKGREFCCLCPGCACSKGLTLYKVHIKCVWKQ